jgi:hypothetical protein
MTPFDNPPAVSPPCVGPASPPAPAHGKRSGSQKRQRQNRIIVGCTNDELAAIENRARSARMSRASFARACMLDSPGPRAQRVPHVNAPVMAQAAAALNKIGSLINQVCQVLHAGGAIGLGSQFDSALDEIRAAARAIRSAAGYGEPANDSQGKPAR